jgi:hypothetical protein
LGGGDRQRLGQHFDMTDERMGNDVNRQVTTSTSLTARSSSASKTERRSILNCLASGERRRQVAEPAI